LANNGITDYFNPPPISPLAQKISSDTCIVLRPSFNRRIVFHSPGKDKGVGTQWHRVLASRLTDSSFEVAYEMG
jgi:hypothetical protein